MVHALMNINIFNINNQGIDCRLACFSDLFCSQMP